MQRIRQLKLNTSRFLTLLAIAGLFCAVIQPVLPAVRGKVVDKEGKPVRGASVTVVTWTADQFVPNETIRSNEHGEFEFELKNPPKEGCHVFLALADGYSYGIGQACIGDDCDLTIKLWPECKLRGSVLDDEGRPLAGVTVKVEKAHSCDTGRSLDFNFSCRDAQVCQVVTGEDGSFIVSHLPGPDDFRCGRVMLTVEGKDRAFVRREVSIDQMRDHIKIVDPPACSLHGIVYLPDKSKTAPADLELMLKLLGDHSRDTREIKLQEDGTFAIYGLPRGKARLMMGPGYYYCIDADGNIESPEKRDWTMPAFELDLAPDRPNELQVIMQSGGVVRGRVIERNSGRPLVDAVVCASHPGRPEGAAPTCTQTDANGEFSIRVMPGDVRVSVDTFKWGSDLIHYQPDEQPIVTLNIGEGEERTGIEFRISPADCEQAIEAAAKPVTSDIELIPGTYHLSWDPELFCKHVVRTEMPVMGDGLIKRAKKLPQLVTTNPRRPAFQFDSFGDEGLLGMIVDESGGTGSGWDTGYMDLNRNWDLSDDEPLRWKAQGNVVSYSNWAEVQARQGAPGSEQANHPVHVRLATHADESTLYMELQRKGAWRGTIDTSKGKVECVLVDTNANGIYGEPVKLTNGNFDFEVGDHLYIDLNGFGCAVPARNGAHEVRLGNITQIGDHFYSIKSSGIGDRITIERYEGPVGELVVSSSGVGGKPAEPVAVGVIGEQGYFAAGTDRPLRVPAGKYRLALCSLNVKGSDNATNPLHLHCGSTQFVDIEAGKKTGLDFSGKLGLDIAPGVKVLKSKPGEPVKFECDFRVGEVGAVSRVCEENHSYESSAQFFDANNKLLASVPVRNACSNCGGACELEIKAPDLKPGSYLLRLSTNTKSVLGTVVGERQFVVVDPAYDVMCAEYAKARNAGDAIGAERVREKLLSQWFNRTIEPGKMLKMDSESQVNEGKHPGTEVFSGTVAWFAETDHIRARAEVTDLHFAVDAPKDEPWRKSCLELFISPGGLNETINQFFIIPEGDNGTPRVVAVHAKDTQGISAAWKRTEKGYIIDVKIPWSKLRGYKKDWTRMPVDAAIDTQTPDGRVQYVLSGVSRPWDESSGYVALERPRGGK